MSLPRCLRTLSAIGLGVMAIAGVMRGGAPAAVLTSAAAVRALAPHEAARALPARLEGVVIHVTSRLPAIVLMDDDEGIFITMSGALVEGVKMGDWLEIEGTTEPGNFAPIVAATGVHRLGIRPLPVPMRATFGEVAAGGFDAHWIEVAGIVRSCTPLREWRDPAGVDAAAEPRPPGVGLADAYVSTFLTLASGNGRLRIRVPEPMEEAGVVDARVRVRGVCFNIHNANRQFVRAIMHVAGGSSIEILTPPPSDPFALPRQRAAELLQFNQAGFSGHRVRVQGVVTRHEAGNALWIRDGERGLRVVSVQAGRIEPGEWVDIAGFVDPGNYSPSLTDAIFRRTATSAPPAAIPIDRLAQAVAHDADLVQIEAELTEVRRTPEGHRLTLGWGDVVVQALLVTGPDAGAAPPGWAEGSRVRVAGICALAPDESGPEGGLWVPRSFRLLLRDSADVTVLRAAPWLTMQRALLLLGVGAVGLIVLIVWLGVVSRRQIAQREAGRKMAETEFAAMLRERNRMARDIHDTLAQGLNAVSMQLELAKNMASRGPDGMLSHVATAHTIVRSCIAEARESIWNMRSQVLERTDLAGALGGVLEQLSAGLPIETEMETTGEKRRLAPVLENNLLRVGQEAISNAIKHARASRLAVRLEFEAGKVRLRIIDNGCGFAVDAAGRVASRFGLAGMKERAEQMHATLELHSAPGQGTEVVVEIVPPK